MQNSNSEVMDSPVAPDLSSLDGVMYLFGYPISHSLSPLFHNTIYKNLSLSYAQFLYETRSLSACLAMTKDPKFRGASVTMPHKVAILPHLTHLTPAAKAIGAVNTIWRTSDGALWGTNTDCIGIREAVLRNTGSSAMEKMKGGVGMVIGGGGTSRSAVYALKQFLGCTTIYLVNRDVSEVEAVLAECAANGIGEGLVHVKSVAEAESLAAVNVIISAIPDFPPVTPAEIQTREVIDVLLSKQKGTLLEMCYHPSSDTGIKRLAESRDWKVIPGVEAMIWQGFEQDRVWLDMEVDKMPVEQVKSVIKAKLAEGH